MRGECQGLSSPPPRPGPHISGPQKKALGARALGAERAAYLVIRRITSKSTMSARDSMSHLLSLGNETGRGPAIPRRQRHAVALTATTVCAALRPKARSRDCCRDSSARSLQTPLATTRCCGRVLSRVRSCIRLRRRTIRLAPPARSASFALRPRSCRLASAGFRRSCRRLWKARLPRWALMGLAEDDCRPADRPDSRSAHKRRRERTTKRLDDARPSHDPAATDVCGGGCHSGLASIRRVEREPMAPS
jgi:hypothetical protein